MPDNLFQRWGAGWTRLVARVPLTDQAIVPELPAEALGVVPTPSGPVKPETSPAASAQPKSR